MFVYPSVCMPNHLGLYVCVYLRVLNRAKESEGQVGVVCSCVRDCDVELSLCVR